MTLRILDSEALTETLEELAHQVADFVGANAPEVDQLEFWLSRVQQWRYAIDAEPTLVLGHQVAIRTWRDGRMGSVGITSAKPSAWRDAFKTSIAQAQPTVVQPPSTPQNSGSSPVVFDPDLPDALIHQKIMPRLIKGMADNALHEAERISGLHSITGEIVFKARHRIVGNRGGIVATLEGEFNAQIELNKSFGDNYRFVHLPESFQPVALLGARTWRTMPRTAVSQKIDSHLPVVLHPRALEVLMRRGLPYVLSAPEDGGKAAFGEGALIADASITLIDDPSLDGLAVSRAFDDEGVATRRTALLIRGRMTQRLRSRQAAAHAKTFATGSARRLPRGGLGPHEAGPQLGFSGLLMERGNQDFNQIVGRLDTVLMVHSLADDLIIDPVSTTFTVTVRWGILLTPGSAEGKLIRAGSCRISGRLLAPDRGPALLSTVLLSREVHDTGSAILPYCLGDLRVDLR